MNWSLQSASYMFHLGVILSPKQQQTGLCGVAASNFECRSEGCGFESHVMDCVCPGSAVGSVGRLGSRSPASWTHASLKVLLYYVTPCC